MFFHAIDRYTNTDGNDDNNTNNSSKYHFVFSYTIMSTILAMTIVRTNAWSIRMDKSGTIPLPENRIGFLRVRFILPPIWKERNNSRHNEEKNETDPQWGRYPPPWPVNSVSEFQNKKHDEQNRSQSQSTTWWMIIWHCIKFWLRCKDKKIICNCQII